MADPLEKLARNFRAAYPVMDDATRRRRKGLKAAAILEEALAGARPRIILDVGCSNALFLDTVAERLRPDLAIGVDLDRGALPASRPERAILLGDATRLPVADSAVDVVICNHTYEHVGDAHRLFAEMRRVLRPGGLVYFSAMNARWPIEPHYHLPFIHWLPARLATAMMRMAGHTTGYLERPRTTAGLRRLAARFEIHDYTLKVIAQPDRFHARDVIKSRRLAPVLATIARLMYGLLPGYLWVLVKPRAAR